MQGKGKRECGPAKKRGSSLSPSVISHARFPPSLPPLSACQARKKGRGNPGTREFPFSPSDLARPNSPFRSPFKCLSCRGKGRGNAGTRKNEGVPFPPPPWSRTLEFPLPFPFKRLPHRLKKNIKTIEGILVIEKIYVSSPCYKHPSTRLTPHCGISLLYAIVSI